MASPLTEFVFIGIIATMLLLLVGLHAIAKHNAKRRLIKAQVADSPPVHYYRSKNYHASSKCIEPG